ncbi:type VI secretion system protein VasJ [Halopseudomonas litoralis]|uniref:Type VI secretion system protein VasJ n=1 Tax=Halopseudomonas litoralis TaxID=797277 RepID=A0A1H1NLK3_9GAMM|nr:type VI secretion system protein TssA [Halopseudomonas litoralis]SDR99862.1 type VI secretion system protein VasJ [Halopseudomonas litoralis]
MLDQYYIDLFELPVEEHNFAGEDTRYTPEFEALEEELAKDTSVHRTTGTDWSIIREGAELLLQTQSKDLRVTCWLVWSLYHTESFAGLAAGLGMLRHACTQHWQELHPSRIRTRSAAIDWLCSRLEQVLGEQAPDAEQLPAFNTIASHLRVLDSLFAKHLNEAAPQLMPLYRRIDELAKRAEAAPQAEPTAPVPSTPSASRPAPSATTEAPGSVDAPIVDNRDAHRSLRALQDRTRPLTAWWLHQHPGDARAIRLARTLLWLPIGSLPEHDAEQITGLRNLPADRLKAYQERFNQGQYTSLLVEVEASLNRAPFWLSGQHLAWRCLEALDAQPAMQELESQLRHLLARLPGLDELRFHDGEPFADSDTRQWLAVRVMAASVTTQTTSCDTTTQTAAPWDLALQEALALLRQEGLRSAMQLLMQGTRQSHSERARFYWQLAEARLCFQARQHEIAYARLDALQQMLQTSGLEKWEPTLNLEVLRLLYACCELLPQSQLVRDRREEIFHRLCHLDFEAVLNKALGP